jgi:hypothetical protein
VGVNKHRRRKRVVIINARDIELDPVTIGRCIIGITRNAIRVQNQSALHFSVKSQVDAVMPVME